MIHSYQLNGYNIVLDVYSGSVHAVDDLAYDVINLYETCSREEIVSRMLAKYRDRPEVTAEEIRRGAGERGGPEGPGEALRPGQVRGSGL